MTSLSPSFVLFFIVVAHLILYIYFSYIIIKYIYNIMVDLYYERNISKITLIISENLNRKDMLNLLNKFPDAISLYKK